MRFGPSWWTHREERQPRSPLNRPRLRAGITLAAHLIRAVNLYVGLVPLLIAIRTPEASGQLYWTNEGVLAG